MRHIELYAASKQQQLALLQPSYMKGNNHSFTPSALPCYAEALNRTAACIGYALHGAWQ
jgi:hypothetical protein